MTTGTEAAAPEFRPDIQGLRAIAVIAVVALIITNTYLKQMQAPAGVKPILKAWMELN